MPAPAQSFNGIARSDLCGATPCGDAAPPSTVGDVGPSNYIEAVNDALAIYSKTGTLETSLTFNSLWSGAGTGSPCDAHNQDQPTVTIDPQTGQWIITDIAFTRDGSGNPQGPFAECIAVSKTTDPVNGGWYRNALALTAPQEPSYPQVGVWTDAIYLAFDVFSGTTFVADTVFAMDRGAMESTGAFNAVGLNLTVVDPNMAHAIPANFRGTTPPAGRPEFMAAESDLSSSVLHLFKVVPDFTTPASSTVTETGVSGLASYTGSSCQAGTTPPQATQPAAGAVLVPTHLDAICDRLMPPLQYRDINGTESLWTGQTVGTTPLSIRWTQINVTGGTVVSTPVQSAIWAGSGGLDRWMPSLAVDQNGDMAVGYSASSASVFPGLRWAGRLASDPANTLGQGEATVKAGGYSQLSCDSLAPCSRWGYSSMSVDPSDGCTFWLAGEFFANGDGGHWHTRIGSFRFPSCSATVSTVTAPPVLKGSPFTITFSSPAKNVVTPFASAGAIRVVDVATGGTLWTSLGGSGVTCFDATNSPVDCSAGPVSSAQLATPGLEAGDSYKVQVDTTAAAPVMDYTTGQSVPASTTTLRAQTVFAYNQYPITYKWGTVTNANAHGGSYATESASPASETFSFSGGSLDVFLWQGPAQGIATVKVTTPGKKAVTQTVDTYSATKGDLLPAATFTGLAAGPHTAVITVTGTKNAASTGTAIGVDGFNVDGVPNDTPKLTARWSDGPGYGYAYTRQKGASIMMAKAYGTGFQWNVVIGPTGGQANVYVNGTLVKTEDLYAPNYQNIPETYLVNPITPSQNSLRIVVTGTHQPASSDVVIRSQGITVL
jgi:hypothetical protein